MVGATTAATSPPPSAPAAWWEQNLSGPIPVQNSSPLHSPPKKKSTGKNGLESTTRRCFHKELFWICTQSATTFRKVTLSRRTERCTTHSFPRIRQNRGRAQLSFAA